MYAKSNTSELKLVAIKTKDKVFISDNITGESYHHTRLKDLLFDGELAKSTYDKNWFELNTIPTKIERKLPPRRINQRYELKEGFQETELIPKVINKSYIDKDDEFYEVKGLYDFKYETTEEGYEEVEFSINIIEELEEGFEIVKVDYDLKYNLIDRIQTHPILLTTKPCYLTKQESFNIVRNHVKLNIDPRYAEVTSDYDFCFSVKKKIAHEPEPYSVNINLRYPRRKPKYETRYRRNRSITIYEIAPEPYNSYPVIEEFTGKNYEDLQNNINTYLEELMEKINKPYVECSHCKGMGVVLDEN